MLRSLLLCTLLSAGLVWSTSSDVLDLTDADFESTVAKHPLILVEFFAPWCGHCKRLAPEYEKAATALQKEDPSVPLAKVDCTANTETCQKHGVSGYPTLKIFRNGEVSKDYAGPREADGIVRYMRTESGPSSRELKSSDEWSKFVGNDDHSIIGYFSDGMSALKDKFVKVADTLKEELRFGHTHDKSLFSDGKYENKVVIHRPKRLQNKFEDDYAVCPVDEESTLKECLKKGIHGLVGHRTASNTAGFLGPLLTVFYDVDYVKNAKGTNYWRNRVLKVADALKEEVKDKLKFAVGSATELGHELSEFGMDAAGAAKAPLVALKDAAGRKFVMKEDFSVEGLTKFVKDFISDKLTPYLKSEEVPEDNTKPVKVVVAKNFDEIVNNADKDVLIEFYAPWCGHCKKLIPIYDELAEKLKDEPELTIAKMDATANDVPSNFNVRGFPTIYFVPKNDKKNPKQYNGGREVDDFVQYLSKESTNPLKSFNRSGKPEKEL